jgi:hypothetical protein
VIMLHNQASIDANQSRIMGVLWRGFKNGERELNIHLLS